MSILGSIVSIAQTEKTRKLNLALQTVLFFPSPILIEQYTFTVLVSEFFLSITKNTNIKKSYIIQTHFSVVKSNLKAPSLDLPIG